MSSKAKKPTLGERLVRVKDLLPFSRLVNDKLADLEHRLAVLEDRAKASE